MFLPGIRSSIHQSYLCSPISENSWFKSGPEERAESFKKLLYGLCFLHALLQQRARYEAWNYRYDFCLSDMRTAAVDLKILVEESLDDEVINRIISIISYFDYSFLYFLGHFF